MMASEFVFDSDVWPKLPTATGTTAMPARTDDWEILDDSNELDTRHLESKETAFHAAREPADFVMVQDDDNETVLQEQSTKPNRKVLRHSLSSPILTGTCGKDIRNMSSDDIPSPGVVERDELDDGFTLVSEAASVWTTTSTVTSARTVSFRDAILLSPNSDLTAQTSTRVQLASTTKIQRSRVQPRFVVVQSPPNRIRRCSKSTGNLLELNLAPLLEDEDSKDTGFSDLDHDRCLDDEFYYRKALGSASRINGLKLRPDEAKRRVMILNKKDQQRLATSRGSVVKSAARDK